MESHAHSGHLNPRQQEAVAYDKGHLLITAGPGTGKTHTLIHRIIHNQKDLPAGRKLLAITFTHKAADELRRRLKARGDTAADSVTAGTFHQVCLGFLRAYGGQTGLSADFQVATPEQCEELILGLWPQLTVRERRIRLANISRWKAAALDDDVPAEVNEYNAVLRKNNRLDFDDLLLETVMLLRNAPGVLSELRDSYNHVFVDEYQDINPAQHALLTTFVGGRVMITAIGDPNQAIYGFRGSNAGFFRSFPDDFPGAAVLSLTDNYRSARDILAASGQVMAAAGQTDVPELTARIYTQGLLRIHAAATEKAEAEYVAHQIEKLVGGTSLFSYDTARVERDAPGNRSFGDIAVLYRLNSQRAAVQKALDRAGIPYQVSGKQAADDSQDAVDPLFTGLPEEPEWAAEKVSLMTLHASKGLEFPVVFIIGCEQNILPLSVEGLDTDNEEERRLFYVGMTRAREELFLVRASSRFLYGRRRENPSSEFLADIEEQLKNYDADALRGRKPKKVKAQLTLFE